MIKIEKHQEYVDDVAGEVYYLVTRDSYWSLGQMKTKDLLELKEALNNLDIK